MNDYISIRQQPTAPPCGSVEYATATDEGRHDFRPAALGFIAAIFDAFPNLGHRGRRLGVPTKALPNGRDMKVFPIGLAVVAVVFALSACGSSGSTDVSGAGQTLRDSGQTMTTNAGVMQDSGQMMLDNGQAMMDAGRTMMTRGKALGQDDMTSLGQQMMDKGKTMRAAGQAMMGRAQTMMTQGQQMSSRGHGMMGG